MGPGHAGIPGNKHADSLLKAGTSLNTAMVPGSSPQLFPKLVSPGVTNGDVTFPLLFQLSHCYNFSNGISPLTPHILLAFRRRFQRQSLLQLL